MVFFRSLFVCMLMLAIGSAALAINTSVCNDGPCIHNVADQHRDRGGEDSLSGHCALGSVGCTPSAVTSTVGFIGIDRTGARVVPGDAAAFDSLALAPETAPPKHFR